MIGKIVAGSGAGGVTSYVTGKDGAEILLSTWSGPPELWASQIDAHTQEMGSGVAQTVVHVSLAAAPGERLSDDQWRAVAEEYLSRMGWGDHDHAVVRHTDTAHDHVHIIVARVGRDGQTADLHNDFPRQERVLDGIERDFGLERTHEQIRIEAEKNPVRAVESATRNALTFDRAQIERYFDRLGFEPDKTRGLTDRAMSDERVLQAGDRFTTAEVQQEVRSLDDALRELAGQDARPGLDRGGAAREGLDTGQRAAADRIAAGGGLVVVEGFAGAGKSTMLREAAADLKFSGHDVIGVAPSGKAAKGLQDSAGIDSNTLTKTLMQIEGGERKLTANSVVIVDEAGMARNDELGRLASAVADAGGRLVLVGDEKQIGAVGRGGGFAEAREIAGGGTARLDEIHRQREGWQRDATQAFGEGRASDAIQSYVEHGKVEWAASRGTARNMLVADYVRELNRGTSPKDMLAIGHENRDVKAMNTAIRDAIKERGGLHDAREYKLENAPGKMQRIEIGKGDRVVFEKNNARSGEKNGEFGTVLRTDSRGFDVRMDDGRTQRIENGGKHQLSRGYASSIHKSQGSTVGKTFVLASKGMDSKLTYVALSRQKDDAKLYANKSEFKSESHLKSALARDGEREAFKSVLAAGQAKTQGAQKEQHHVPPAPAEKGGGAGGKSVGSWIDATLAAQSLERGDWKSGLGENNTKQAKENGREGGSRSEAQQQSAGKGQAQAQPAGEEKQAGEDKQAGGKSAGASAEKVTGHGAQAQERSQADAAGRGASQSKERGGDERGQREVGQGQHQRGTEAGRGANRAQAGKGERPAGKEQAQAGKAQSAGQKQAQSKAQKSQDHGQQAGGREKIQAKDAGHGQGQGKGKGAAQGRGKGKSKGYGL
jgi:hypothetical protein